MNLIPRKELERRLDQTVNMLTNTCKLLEIDGVSKERIKDYICMSAFLIGVGRDINLPKELKE